MDWLADRGGGGAIDLVMHVREYDFKAAVEWLSGRKFSSPVVIAPQKGSPEEPRPLVMPTVNEQRWEAVQHYLVETRKLPLALVERLHEKGLIYADDFQNAVFVRHRMLEGQWRRGDITGASLRGTWGERNTFRRMAPGTVRDRGWFWLGTGRGAVSRVLLTESPIDTMSLAVLDRQNRCQNGVTLYLSVDGAGALPVEALKAVMQRGGKVVIAFDADKAGELMAWRVSRHLPAAERLLPIAGKDWNEELIGSDEPVPHLQKSSRLWKWHSAAFTLNRSEKYLNRISEIAVSCIDGNSLSREAKKAMQQDLNQFRKRLPMLDTYEK